MDGFTARNLLFYVYVNSSCQEDETTKKSGLSISHESSCRREIPGPSDLVTRQAHMTRKNRFLCPIETGNLLQNEDYNWVIWYQVLYTMQAIQKLFTEDVKMPRLPLNEQTLLAYGIQIGHTDYIVTCIARQRTGKHLATEYTNATIELRMLLPVAKQQSTPIKSITRNYITGFLWVCVVTIAMQRLEKRTFNNGETVFRVVRAEGLS
jgi:hypothetical protein